MAPDRRSAHPMRGTRRPAPARSSRSSTPASTRPIRTSPRSSSPAGISTATTATPATSTAMGRRLPERRRRRPTTPPASPSVAWGRPPDAGAHCRCQRVRVLEHVAQGLTWAADNGARVANISYVGVAASSTVQSAAQYMRNKGGVVAVDRQQLEGHHPCCTCTAPRSAPSKADIADIGNACAVAAASPAPRCSSTRMRSRRQCAPASGGRPATEATPVALFEAAAAAPATPWP